ncbi:DUF3300 domain-containing protein [uncultured Desulfuromusa sp.]|uniref:DUF3300 domain-containing protein n=1 Tax=uncultured Desulfuromusa sp. TaxID=219183 RepID=UPI002AA88169|nr:DUF3300 domain-containing protein [uncultured Desulfuromusa sp.]
MKARVFNQRVKQLIFFSFFCCCFVLPSSVFAADTMGQVAGDSYSQQELTQMLAPIALYPDALLSQILMASTYPIEVIEADRWVKVNSHLEGDALDEALYEKNWDPSVQALCHFPSTLARMSEQISETTDLGNAFLAQEADVMTTVQHLREKAYAEGNLYTNKQQKVVVGTESIIIESVYPHMIYVPYYDPYYVYGSWWYPGYLPYYWGPSSVHLGVGISFYPGIRLNFAFGSWSYFDWPRHRIYVNVHKRPRFVRKERVISTHTWRHVPSHRRGVAYRDKRTAQRYGQSPHRSLESRRGTSYYTIDKRGIVIRSKRYDNTIHTPRKQPQMKPSNPRVFKQQQQHRSTDQGQRIHQGTQPQRSISNKKQPSQKRQIQSPPQTRTPEKERIDGLKRMINRNEERQTGSSRYGNGGRRNDPGR